MIQAMFDKKAGKYRLHVEGNKDDILKDLLAIMDELLEKKILNKDELEACVKAATMEKKEIVKEILDRMPMIMLAAAMGNEQAQQLADRFIDIFKKDDNE